jgi:hypothetical protein
MSRRPLTMGMPCVLLVTFLAAGVRKKRKEGLLPTNPRCLSTSSTPQSTLDLVATDDQSELKE